MKNKLYSRLCVLCAVLYAFLIPQNNLFGQLVACPPSSCSPNPCYCVNVVNTTNCEMCWLWAYPGVDCSMNPGGCTPAGQTRNYVAPCAQCDDGPCQCPHQFWLADPGSATGYAAVIDIVTGTSNTYVVDYTACCGGQIKIIYTMGTPLNPCATIRIECY